MSRLQLQNEDPTSLTREPQELPIFNFIQTQLKPRALRPIGEKNTDKLSLQIVKASIKYNSYVSYEILAVQGNKYCTFESRYSEIRNVYKKMKKDHRDDKNIDKFLGFPGKQVFGNLDKDLIKQRTEKMNEFLRKTSSNKELTKYLKSFVSQHSNKFLFTYDPNELDQFQLDF